MRLEEIGFYTMEDRRVKQASMFSPLWRCELVLTGRCNFYCSYCRGVGGEDLSYEEAINVIWRWADDGVCNIRFSGGEPTLLPYLVDICKLSYDLGIKRIAVSTNGSASLDIYKRLLDVGVNDFSVSLDACCAEDVNRIAGGIKGAFETIVTNIRWLASRVYLTVGIVVTLENQNRINDTICFADNLGVSDIRVIPAAQNSKNNDSLYVNELLLAKYPILRYRIQNLQTGRSVRGLQEGDSHRCYLVLDDMAVCQGRHYPCIIYLRESGEAIGKMGKNIRIERQQYAEMHDTGNDSICINNCLDVCIDYNRKWEEVHKGGFGRGES